MEAINVYYYLAILNIIISVIYLLNYKKSRFIPLGIIFLSGGLLAVYDGYLITRDIYNIPTLYGLYNMFYSINLVAFYFFFKLYFDTGFYWKKKYFLYFIPTLLLLALWVPYGILDEKSKTEFIKSTIGHMSSEELPGKSSEIIFLIFSFYIYFQCMNIFLKRFKFKNIWNDILHYPTLKNGAFLLFIWGFLHMITEFIIMLAFVNEEWISILKIVTYTNAILIINFLNLIPILQKSGLFVLNEKTGIFNNYIKRHLDDNSVSLITRNIQDIFLKEKLYMEEDMLLPLAASKLQVTSHQLSEFLNQHENISYSDWINKMRVDEAERLFFKNQLLTVAEVCYAVGFNSISAFYRSCKKFKGVTPVSMRITPN